MQKMSLTDECALLDVLSDHINDSLIAADSLGINHPYWTEDTAKLMAEAALAVVKACTLPQQDAG